jgi:hypothetical protein
MSVPYTSNVAQRSLATEAQPWNFLMTRQALWPPNPKLFDSATSVVQSRDSLGM